MRLTTVLGVAAGAAALFLAAAPSGVSAATAPDAAVPLAATPDPAGLRFSTFSICAIDPKTGEYFGVADRRIDGKAIGVK